MVRTVKDVVGWFQKDTLFNEINRRRRAFFINVVQEPLVRGILRLALKYPEPQPAKLIKQNSLVLLGIFDDMLMYEKNPRIKSILEAMKRVVIGKNEASNHYGERIDVFLEKLTDKYNNGEFRKRRPWTPSQYWDEPSVIQAKRQRAKELVRLVGIGLNKEAEKAEEVKV